MSGDITKNISRWELRCKCGNCNYSSADIETVMAVQFACNHFAEALGVQRVKLNITGPTRCPKHNQAVGGAENSYHLSGAALDHSIDGVSSHDLADFYRKNYFGKFGVGEYETFVHLDSRATQHHWKG